MKELCYLVHQAEDYGENHVILGVFKDKQKAEAYCNVQKGLNPYDIIYVTEERYKDDSFDINTKVTSYFMYGIDSSEDKTLAELDEYNEMFDTAEPAIWVADNFIEILEDRDIVGYSNESYSKAREIALDYSKKYDMGVQEKIDYKVIDRRQKDESK